MVWSARVDIQDDHLTKVDPSSPCCPAAPRSASL